MLVLKEKEKSQACFTQIDLLPEIERVISGKTNFDCWSFIEPHPPPQKKYIVKLLGRFLHVQKNKTNHIVMYY